MHLIPQPRKGARSEPNARPVATEERSGIPGMQAGKNRCEATDEQRKARGRHMREDGKPVRNRAQLCRKRTEALIGMRKGSSAPYAVLIGIDGRAGFAVGFAAAFGFALVPVLFALGDGEFALDAAIFEIEAGGDERMSLDLRL